jgi:hypothetical protein
MEGRRGKSIESCVGFGILQHLLDTPRLHFVVIMIMASLMTGLLSNVLGSKSITSVL